MVLTEVEIAINNRSNIIIRFYLSFSLLSSSEIKINVFFILKSKVYTYIYMHTFIYANIYIFIFLIAFWKHKMVLNCGRVYCFFFFYTL